MAPVSSAARRGRGRVATHHVDALLDLVVAVAREAVAQGKVMTPARVSMPTFNIVKLDVDRDRGIADPRGDPERTPTAEAIQMRFKQLAERPVKWDELVDGALRPGRDRTMWLSALSRDKQRDDLTDELVIHALRLVASRRQSDVLARGQYDETRGALVHADVERNGEEALLPHLLPTSNQVLAYCDFRWEKALKLARLKPYIPPRTERHRPPPAQVWGMPTAMVVAFYGAVNGAWPSHPTLLHFAGSCGIAMAVKPAGGMGPVREEASRLLLAEGVTPPTRTRGGGKGKRLTYRYPVNGIPGAPLRDPGLREHSSDPRVDALRRELAVMSLRVWLAGLPTRAPRVRAEYVSWQVGTDWPSAGLFDRYDYGGFSALKQEADDANARVRQAGGDPLVEALARASGIRDDAEAVKATLTLNQPDAVPFGEALRVVLASPLAEAQPPGQ